MERIHVTVRSRPLSLEDAKASPWRILGNSIFIPNHSAKFEFDHVFGEECKTEEIYRARTKDIVAAAVRGFNGTVFAYGQTNSGKTHTMRGTTTEPGVIPLAVHDLFDIIQEDVDREFLLRMSYMEIYNEDINDLLAPEHRKLQIHESLERGIYVAGLREEIVVSPPQVLDFMQFGESHRHIGETNMNVYSSRSHTIFRMIIESRDRTEDDSVGSSCDAVRVSVLNLVDLAGSERAAKTGAEGVRLKEGSHINKSLMTLGTVIKKLSEGAESNGGHVPYRDSKLTRILQPALGGNANTAIICNITLAQIHADETKSSLQFASRALRVTNCAHVNEILTDAALLKRQKKEIEELRAKLQGSHSEHLEEEILNLRNTLLQSELERERITLELEEEKRAQAEREKVLLEQAKKIKNLSSMVLYSGRDENRDQQKKGKRRDTWCPSNLSRESLQEVDLNRVSRPSAVNPMKTSRDVGPLLPFEELLSETDAQDDVCQPQEDRYCPPLEEAFLPNPCALLHVTNRKKVPPKKKNSPVEDHEVLEMEAEYEELFLKSETQRTMSAVHIDCLTRQLIEIDSFQCIKHDGSSTDDGCDSICHMDKNINVRESEAIFVIKQLQEKIKRLEMEKSSSQHNLNSVVEQNICAREKFEELQDELQIAREDARTAREQLASDESSRRNDFSVEIEDIALEVKNSVEVVDSVSSLMNEVFMSFSTICNVLADLKALISQASHEEKLIFSNYEKVVCCTNQKIAEIENEKLLLYNQSIDFQKQIQELGDDAKRYEDFLRELGMQQDLEKEELLSQIEAMEREISCLTSCSLAKEKENLRKDLEKTKVKLKETEFKLRNAVQDKTKLEGEKAAAEREVKRLHGQKTLLERDISKRESIAGRRRDSVVERSSKVLDPKKAKISSSLEQTMQEDYKKLEVLAFEMETTIASLEEEVVIAQKEKEEAILRNETLSSDLEAVIEQLKLSNAELNLLQEEISRLGLQLEESACNEKNMESRIKLLEEQKEELAMQLSDSLLEMEEEKAIWFAKEKVSIEAIEEQAKLHNAEITALSKELSEVRSDLESCLQERETLKEKLLYHEENTSQEKKSSIEKLVETDQLNCDLKRDDVESKHSQEFDRLTAELRCACEKVDELETEITTIKKERDYLFTVVKDAATGLEFEAEMQNLQNKLINITEERDKLRVQIEEYRRSAAEAEFIRIHCDDKLIGAKAQVEELNSRLSSMEAKMQNDENKHKNEKVKLRMRLRGTQAKLDAFRFRQKEAMEEMDVMNRRYEEASRKLKDKLASCGIENLNLKKQLAAATGAMK
ncbi:hypothetical protein K2173_010824 [Erythroxylum novogranatense]|uniref:Kinesin motor domain-containing protein n=1 Tax=Erythroxylum novogranatense TaxID=1862640 RepID=A0AAV8T178_9ROSI|nr:hypothetical protein K2173_010824 [Erythroxylum novogranatense]